MISERIESGWIRDRLRSWGLNYEMTKRQRRGSDSLPFPRSEWTVLLQRCGWAHSFAKRRGKFGTISLLLVNWKHKPSVGGKLMVQVTTTCDLKHLFAAIGSERLPQDLKEACL